MHPNFNKNTARRNKWEDLQPNDKVRVSLTPEMVVDAIVDEVDINHRFLWIQIGGARERKLVHYAERHSLHTF